MKTCPQCHLAYPASSSFCFVDGSSLVASKDPRVGSTIAGRYVLEDPLGIGGMATVYRGHHKLVDRPCAIKVLSAQFAADPVLRERFRREARHAQRVAHPNIIEVFDQGEMEDGTPFLAMELLHGKSLAEVIEDRPLPITRALPIVIEMTRALARAHDFDVIHRDLKPENVFLLPGDRVKLLDFGIARCTQDARITNLGEVFGTPQYMAPERGMSIDAGPSADLYALGIMLYELVTGRLPFEANDPASWLIKHLKAPIPHLRQILPSAPPALDQLIYDLLAKSPADRPIDAHAVLFALVSICRTLNIPIPPELEAAPSPVSISRLEGTNIWERRCDLFDKMLARAFGNAAPFELVRLLDSLKVHLGEVGGLRARGLDEQKRLEAIESEGREGRLRLGKAMDALTIDISKTREEARALRAAVAPFAETARTFPPQVIAAHKELIFWEGRSGFHEPYRELAAGYAKLADLVTSWYEIRQKELAADAEAAKKERVISDVDYQIKELRQSLAALDKSIEDRRNECQHRIAELGRRSEMLEGEILHQASRFCAPLRARPELGLLFSELERVPG